MIEEINYFIRRHIIAPIACLIGIALFFKILFF